MAHGEIAGPAGRSRAMPGPTASCLQIVEARSLAGGERAATRISCRWPRCGRRPAANCARALLPATLAELRQFRREGALVDALSQDGFALALAEAIERQATSPMRAGDGSGAARSAFARRRCSPISPAPERLVVRRLGAEQSNSSVLFEEYGVLKLYRRLQPGLHPEIEMGRFLVERAGFANTPPLLAHDRDGVARDRGRGSAPRHDGARRVVRVCAQSGRRLDPGARLSAALSRRRAERGRARRDAARPRRRTARPRSFLSRAGAAARAAHRRRCTARWPSTAATIRLSRRSRSPATDLARVAAASWKKRRRPCSARLERGRAEPARAGARGSPTACSTPARRCSRRSGTLAPDDGRRGQDPPPRRLSPRPGASRCRTISTSSISRASRARPMAERRRKSSPLRDVAGMIRSFDYAAIAAVRQIAETRPAALPRLGRARRGLARARGRRLSRRLSQGDARLPRLSGQQVAGRRR